MAPGMHADELATDATLVRGLLEEQFPEWVALPVERVALVGTDNALYRLGDELVVRLPRRRRPALTLEKECRWLPRLAPLLPLPVPTLVAVGAPTAGFPLAWAVYRWLPGERATPDRIADEERFALDLARFVDALRRVDARGAPPPGEHNAFRGVPLAARDAPTRAAAASLEESVDVARVTAEWETALRAPPWRGPPVWIHGDLDAQNLLAADGRLAAVIDFGCLGAGDPACDVMTVWKVLSADTRERFRSALEIDDPTWARSRGWALSQALSALAYYTTETHPVLVREARRWLDELLA